MNLSECADDELIIRAISSAHIAPSGDISSNLFTGSDISVSRLAVLPRKKIHRILFLDLHKPPKCLVKEGEISVGKLKSIAVGYKPAPRKIKVVLDPIRCHPVYFDNPAHAGVRPDRDINRGLAHEIIRALRKEDIPQPGRLGMAWIRALRISKKVAAPLVRLRLKL